MSFYELAANLDGKKIGDWTVIKKLSGAAGRGGGGFSSGYLVEDSKGRKGYLKALNVAYAVNSTGRDFVDMMNDMTADHRHERDIVQRCNNLKMEEIVIGLEADTYKENGFLPVPYLIFEHSESGDVSRSPLMASGGLEWRLKIFHGVSVAVAQLHKERISHQDIKPDNVLLFAGDRPKLADLGRATIDAPGARFGAPGDSGNIHYSAFELWYGYHDPSWDIRRRANDIFMLGGFLTYLVLNVNILPLVFQVMPDAMLPRAINPAGWTGDYKGVLPAVQSAFYKTVDDAVKGLRSDLSEDIKKLILGLCEPDPARRGHLKTVGQIGGDRYSLERVIAEAAKLAILARVPPK